MIIGAPMLEILNLESTQVTSYSALSQLVHLSSLNLSHCPSPSEEALCQVSECRGLESLNLAAMALPGSSLHMLRGTMWY